MRILYTFLFFFVLNCTTLAQTERTFQVWNKNEGIVRISENMSVIASEKIHYSVSQNNISMKYGDIVLRYLISEYFTLGGGFRLAHSRDNQSWVHENRPMALGILSKQYGNINVSHTNRVEYRFFDKKEDHYRYYQQLNIAFADITKLKLGPYLAGETYTKFNQDNLHLARIYAGVNTINTTNFRMKIYYGFQKQKSYNAWHTSDILGMNMSILL